MITDEGFLNNPYRSYRFVNPSDDRLFALAREIYPRTRTSNAVAFNARYYLPWRAAVHGGYRFFTDTWGIDAEHVRGWATRIRWAPWTFDVGYRHYTQGNADFYSDLFERVEPAELPGARQGAVDLRQPDAAASARPTSSLPNGWRFIKKGTLNLRYDRIEFDYEDFRDARFSLLPADDASFRAAGTEPLYTFGANVIQVFVSVWF